jgi:hypothetical protein
MKRSPILTVLCLLSLGNIASPANAAEPVETPAAANHQEQDVLRSYLQIQEQLHRTQMAIESMRREAKESADLTAEALANNTRFYEARIKSIEDSLAQQRTLEVEALRASHRLTMVVAGTLGVLGFCAVLLTAFFHWRTLQQLTEVISGASTWRGMPLGPQVQALAYGGAPGSDATAQSSKRLMGALEQLDKRILGLEDRSHPKLQPPADPDPASNMIPAKGADSEPTGSQAPDPGAATAHFPAGTSSTSSPSPPSVAGDDVPDVNQAPLQAMGAFEHVLKDVPESSDVFIRKGAELERTGRFEEAIACYDSAIAANSSLTIAYLNKGGVLYRMERFAEALECYEKALQTQNG